MDILHNMRVFTRVVDAGSFTAAASSMDITSGQASRAVSELETHVQARLLNRTTRRIALTDTGARYFGKCQHILESVDQAEAEARDAFFRPSGKLRVHAMGSFSQHYVVPAVGRYQQLYPDVRIELTINQRMPDLLEEGYDVSLVASTRLEDSGLISQRLGTAFSIVCASPEYLAKHGVPQCPADLVGHIGLQIETPVYRSNLWSLRRMDDVENIELGLPIFKVNVADAMVVAVKTGLGIGLLPVYTAMDGLSSGELKRILPDYVSQEMDIFAMYLSREFLDAKIRTWIDFLREEIPKRLSDDVGKLRYGL
ncbi:LysR family transcriptional regulator [Caballeronia udeis]|uniref:LysR family transcriptional regulator n=1 Tax=Caballeronia udeis TaxID=1232866 RepID=A0A158FKB7_9BURK|nr:LysR family transcriptional regulator [Caballeronia udeis]SAL19530.1 LysR family transcriptional regulator [Caballeronia udeis]